MATVPKKTEGKLRGRAKKIWQAETREEALKLKEAFAEKYEEKYPKAARFE